MMSMLPDRERRHLLQFHIAPRLSYGKRLLVALVLIVAGLALQYVLLQSPDGLGPALGAAALLFTGTLFLLLKGYDLKPRDATGGDWERTTIDRFDEVFTQAGKIGRWDSAFADVTCGLGCFTFLVFVLVPACVVVVLLLDADDATAALGLVVLVDLVVLIVPHWFTGVRKKWKPDGLVERIGALRTALAKVQGAKSPSCQVQPMMRVVKRGDRQVPTDARVFIRFPDGPEEFLGLQFQVAINMVQGRRFPYLYAVLVAKKEFKLIERHLSAVLRLCEGRNLTVEKKREKDVDVIVIRQHTTRKTGYHTNDSVITKLAATVWGCVAAVLKVPVS